MIRPGPGTGGWRLAARAASLLLAGLVLTASPLGPRSARAKEPVAGGDALLDATENAVATVVGVVREPARIDTHGWAGSLEVERSLAGPVAAGTVQRIAWEELALARPPRFANGERVVVALAALPGISLWQQRFPPGPDAPTVLVVAAEGNGFLRQPDPSTIEGLDRYLALPSEERVRGHGVAALAALMREAEPAVASAALRRLAAIPGVGALLDHDGRQALASAAADESRPFPLRSDLVGWIGRERIVALRPTLASLASSPGSPLQAEAVEALGILDGGLPADRSAALLRSRDPKLRIVGVRFVATAKAEEELVGLLRNDPAPTVRAAAARELVARRGAAAVDDVASGLFDAAPDVRAAAAQALASVGEPAVPTLLRLTLERTGSETHGPIAALALAGPAGGSALVEVAASHRDPAVRKIARFALGEAPGENEATLDPAPENPSPPAGPE